MTARCEALVTRIHQVPDLRLATAESCTSGQIVAALTSIAGASRIIKGGIVAYTNQAKQDLLGVNERLIKEFTAVSDSVATAMAQGALHKLDASAALAITGYLDGVFGIQWYVALAIDDKVITHHFTYPSGTMTRMQARDQATYDALSMLDQYLLVKKQ